MSPSPVTPYLGQAHWIKYGLNSHRPEEVTFNEEKRYFFLVYKYHRCVCVCVCVSSEWEVPKLLKPREVRSLVI